MIVGIGVDVVDITRIESVLSRHGSKFVEKYFPCERQYIVLSKPSRVAGLFAAKEAFIKAVGKGAGYTPFHKICIGYDEYGKPYIYGELVRDTWRVHLSISHDRKIAVAMVVIEEV